MQSPFMELSIIYVNWNSVDFLRESIASVYEYTRDIQFEIIVVDNASPTGDVDSLKQQFPEIIIIKSPKNLGFAGANNLGFRNSSGRFILFLNPDTKLLSPAANRMAAHLESLPNAGIIGCKLLNEDLSVQTSCIQKFPTILNTALDIDYLRNRWPKARIWGTAALFSETLEADCVEVISGACMMIRREVFEIAGLYSEDYFMYAEDLDLCYEVMRSGYSNYYIGDSTVVHYGGRSSSPQRATVMKWKSILRFCRKTRGRSYAFVFRIVMALVAMCRLVIILFQTVVGGMFRKNESKRRVFGKWTAILRTLLTASGANG
jgi:GT2 family glycosyltransferase